VLLDGSISEIVGIYSLFPYALPDVALLSWTSCLVQHPSCLLPPVSDALCSAWYVGDSDSLSVDF
jgi:hypothetical protein